MVILTIFNAILQTVINFRMLSIGGQGGLCLTSQHIIHHIC